VTESTVTGAVATEALGPEPLNVAGVFNVSGLTARFSPSVGPDGGRIVLDFTVKNVSSEPLTSSLDFWVENVLGNRVVAVDDIDVADLAAGETRTITATLTDVGQWAVFTGHVTFTPPASVGDTALSAVTRDSLTLIPPYFLLIIAGLACGLYFASRAVILSVRNVPVRVGGVAQ
jgi:hypothetical protein